MVNRFILNEVSYFGPGARKELPAVVNRLGLKKALVVTDKGLVKFGVAKMENYGFAVTDLGKDVPPEAIVDKVCALHAPLVGLSALMTTTVPSMEETIRQLRQKAPWCKIVVGGAVLNQEYADTIGADKYAKDAMETVRYAEEIHKGLKS